jgi:hypothetical protein
MEDAYLTGHLATLLAFLCVDNTRNLKAVVRALPGEARKDKLDGLIQDVESFAESYTQVLDHLSQSTSTFSLNEMGPDNSKVNKVQGNFALEVAQLLRSLRD